MNRLLLIFLMGLMLVSCGNRSLNESKVKTLVDQCISEMNQRRISKGSEKQFAVDQISQIQLQSEMESFVNVEFHSLYKDNNGEYTVPKYKHGLTFVFRKNMDGDWIFSQVTGMELWDQSECMGLSLN